MFGKSPTMKPEAVAALSEDEAAKLGTVVNRNKKRAFLRQAVLPAFMLICYLALFLYFRARGGYKPVEIGAGAH